MLEVVKILSQASPKAEVAQTIQQLADDASKLTGILNSPNDPTLKAVAVMQAAAGDLKSAMRTADRIAGGLQDNAYTEMIEVLMAKKDWIGAHQIAAGIREQWMASEHTALSFRELSKSEVRAGEGKQGLDWARQLPVPLAKANALLGVAEGTMDSVDIELIFPRFRRHLVKQQPSLPRTRPGSHSRGSSDDASDYRTPRCTRRCPVSLLHGSRSADGTQAHA